MANTSSYATSTVNSQIAGYRADYEDLLEAIDDLYEAPTWDSTQVTDKFEELAELIDDLTTVWTSLEGTQQNYLEQVLDSVEAINVTQTYEQAWKTLKKYEIKTAIGYLPSTAGYDDLETVAGSNQESYGSAVRHAWYYMHDCDRHKLIMPEEGTEESKESVQAHIPVGANKLIIKPNPAIDEIMVSLPSATEGYWSIVDISGQNIKTGTWHDLSQQTLSVKNLVPGLYHFVLVPIHGDLMSAKLVIIR